MKTHSRRAAECREGADSGRSSDRDQTAQFIGLRMSLKPIDLYALAHDDRPASRCGLLVNMMQDDRNTSRVRPQVSSDPPR